MCDSVVGLRPQLLNSPKTFKILKPLQMFSHKPLNYFNTLHQTLLCFVSEYLLDTVRMTHCSPLLKRKKNTPFKGWDSGQVWILHSVSGIYSHFSIFVFSEKLLLKVQTTVVYNKVVSILLQLTFLVQWGQWYFIKRYTHQAPLNLKKGENLYFFELTFMFLFFISCSNNILNTKPALTRKMHCKCLGPFTNYCINKMFYVSQMFTDVMIRFGS